jgi:hypothetical protein
MINKITRAQLYRRIVPEKYHRPAPRISDDSLRDVGRIGLPIIGAISGAVVLTDYLFTESPIPADWYNHNSALIQACTQGFTGIVGGALVGVGLGYGLWGVMAGGARGASYLYRAARFLGDYKVFSAYLEGREVDTRRINNILERIEQRDPELLDRIKATSPRKTR